MEATGQNVSPPKQASGGEEEKAKQSVNGSVRQEEDIAEIPPRMQVEQLLAIEDSSHSGETASTLDNGDQDAGPPVILNIPGSQAAHHRSSSAETVVILERTPLLHRADSDESDGTCSGCLNSVIYSRYCLVPATGIVIYLIASCAIGVYHRKDCTLRSSSSYYFIGIMAYSAVVFIAHIVDLCNKWLYPEKLLFKGKLGAIVFAGVMVSIGLCISETVRLSGAKFSSEAGSDDYCLSSFYSYMSTTVFIVFAMMIIFAMIRMPKLCPRGRN